MERMITIMTKFEIISLKLNGWSNCRIQREFSVSRNTIRKYWNDYQTKV
ncbi:MAG: helix-turn-helix domain-containing protein, partial [Erysipelotrichaceae bacterium]|nr:helix-turn-helix domain-containing protein [Erysipelotrichaceae bacterium]